MLRSFRVANHLSLRAEQELVLLPAYDKTFPVVPVAAIFGANAAGKSNLLDALRFMQSAVRTSALAWEAGTGVPRRPFLFGVGATELPSSFVAELLLDGVRHIYGFEVDDDRVREEWLYAFPRGRRRVIFDREGQTIRFGSTVAVPKMLSEALTALTAQNTLFLTSATQSNLADTAPIYDWFRANLVVTDADHRHADWTRLTRRLLPGAPSRVATVKLIQAADLGVTDVVVDEAMVGRRGEIHVEPGKPPPLLFRHADSRALASFEDESGGTHAWLRLVDLALTALEGGQVLAVDEIDSSLHPRLTPWLIELFRSTDHNPGGAQLLVTTHDASLLSPAGGADTLSRDQVWFIEKNAAGESSLFPLTDFHPRKGENTERRYLGGSYGAIPEVSEQAFVEAMEALPEPARRSA